MTNDELAAAYARCFPFDEVKWSAADIALHESKPSGIVERATCGGAFLQIVADEGEILSIFVDPNAQGQGRGRALLEQACESLCNHGAKSVFLEVASDNARAVSLYESFGFKTVGTRKNYYAYTSGRKVDAHIMSKSI